MQRMINENLLSRPSRVNGKIVVVVVVVVMANEEKIITSLFASGQRNV